MIRCHLCAKDFRLITNTHLASHSVTVEQYLERFGADSLCSPEYLQKLSTRPKRKGWKHTAQSKMLMSQQLTGKIAHNKGRKMDDDQRRLLSDLAKQRIATRGATRQGAILSNETRQKIRQSLQGRAPSKETIAKIVATRRMNGKPSAMKGRKLSVSHRAIISARSKESWKTRKVLLDDKLLLNIAACNLVLLGGVTENFLQLKCQACNHEFERTRQMFDACRITSDMCPFCFPREFKRSEDELAILDYVRSLLPMENIRCGARDVIRPLELDIYIPGRDIAIEYCGLYWHSEQAGKTRDYHLSKYLKCKEKGIDLITVFEDEYVNSREVVQSVIAARLGTLSKKIYARNTDVVDLTADGANRFLNQYHLQGSGRSNVRLGLVSGGELISVMTFNTSNPSRHGKGWEINRFCTQAHMIVPGAASKLFKSFVRQVLPESVVSFADLRWGSGAVYRSLGFSLVGQSPPNYWYVSGLKRLHRYTLRKTEADDPALTEVQARTAQGWARIWDCGHAKYEWRA